MWLTTGGTFRRHQMQRKKESENKSKGRRLKNMRPLELVFLFLNPGPTNRDCSGRLLDLEIGAGADVVGSGSNSSIRICLRNQRPSIFWAETTSNLFVSRPCQSKA